MSTWTVPSGVTQATFDAYGAQGGGNPVFFLPIIKGGKGGYTSARINVTPGENIYIFVGGEGHNGGTSILTPSPEHSAGGFNGGGNGGFNRHNARAVSGGGGGGGASDIRIGGTGLANRVIVAGGGGGSSEKLYVPCGLSHGGAGGGREGQSGVAAVQGCVGGAGATQASGGNNTDLSAEHGTLGFGGKGRTPNSGAAGGGGGGGYYGGGGGWLGAGGGGGSGFGPSGAKFQADVREGNGQVLVTYN